MPFTDAGVYYPNADIQKSQPTPSSVYINQILGNMSVAYIQSSDQFVTRRVMPTIPTKERTGAYFKYAKGTFTRDEMKLRAPGTPAQMLGFNVTNATYSTDFWSVGTTIPDQTKANQQNPLNVERAAMKLLSRSSEIRLERAFATKYLTTGVWAGVTGSTGTDVTGVAGVPAANQVKQWNDSASTPIKDVATYQTTMQTASDGFRPKGLLIGRQVWDALRNHPEILDRLNRGQTVGPAQVRKDDVASLMELDEITVGDAVYNSAAEGVAISNAFIIGKVGLLYYTTDSPQIEMPSAGYTFAWTGMTGGDANRFGNRFRQYRNEPLLSDVMECDLGFGMEIICPEMGVFFNSLVA